MASSEFTTDELQSEKWQSVIDFDNYVVSDLGRVRRVRSQSGKPQNKLMTSTIRKGYATVKLCQNRQPKRVLIHRAVALAFIGSPTAERPDINHKDANKLNNRPSNLEYCSKAENIAHAVSLGLMPSGDRNGTRTHPERQLRGKDHPFSVNPYKGELHPSAKLTADQVREIRTRYAQGGIRLIDLADEYGVTFGLVGHIIRRRLWKSLT